VGRRSQTGKRIGINIYDERSYEEMMRMLPHRPADLQRRDRRTEGFYVIGTGLTPFSELLMIKMEKDSHTSMSNSIPVTHTEPWCSNHVYI